MSSKITPEHLERLAVVYVRQSTMAQVLEHTESKRRQYELAGMARQLGFKQVETIDDDLGRSGSGEVERPGFQKLVAKVCSGTVGAVLCIEASRLARNGRDWHHLIDLCALVGTLIIDPDGVYEPRQGNDRLLLGLKGTMSEYELSLLRQRSLAARDSKAQRGELRFGLPPGLCWDELGRIEIDPDDRISTAIGLVFRKYREMGSVRQVLLWARDNEIELPVMQRSSKGLEIGWQRPSYHNVLTTIRNPFYAGAYAYGRTSVRTRVENGRARKTQGHRRPMEKWPVLIQDHHPGYISWEDFLQNQTMLAENAHMKKRASRKSARGGRALLTGQLRCGRCGRMLRVVYGSTAGHAHQYYCKGADMRGARSLCLSIGGVRVDKAVAEQLLAAVAPHAIEAAILAEEKASTANSDRSVALERELEDARYDATLARRRYEAVDPDKRLVARELEARWESALERAQRIETRLQELRVLTEHAPRIERERLFALAHDLPHVWNSPTADMRLKQRIVRALVEEIVVDVDAERSEVALMIHWIGGRHTEVRTRRRKSVPFPAARKSQAVHVIRLMAARWSDHEIAVSLNRMRCHAPDGGTWTKGRVQELRNRLGLSEYNPETSPRTTTTITHAAERLGICTGSVRALIRSGVLPATQVLPGAPWEIQLDAFSRDEVRIGVQKIVDRRPMNSQALQDLKTLRLPGV